MATRTTVVVQSNSPLELRGTGFSPQRGTAGALIGLRQPGATGGELYVVDGRRLRRVLSLDDEGRGTIEGDRLVGAVLGRLSAGRSLAVEVG